MSESSRGSVKVVSLTPEDLKALDPEVLKELHAKHGLDIAVRSNSPAVDAILGALGRSSGATAEYTRGFDRTSDMYWKNFDRDTANMRPGDLVINPAERLRSMPLEEALRTLSLEDLARLKAGGSTR